MKREPDDFDFLSKVGDFEPLRFNGVIVYSIDQVDTWWKISKDAEMSDTATSGYSTEIAIHHDKDGESLVSTLFNNPGLLEKVFLA